MKRLAVLAFLVGCGGQEKAEVQLADAHEFCRSIAGQSAAIMRARQSGLPQSDAMQKALDSDPSIRNLTVATVDDAYRMPRMVTEEDAKRLTTEFSDKSYQLCMSSTK